MTEWVNTKNDVFLKRFNNRLYTVVGLAWFYNDFSKTSECVETDIFTGTKYACVNFIENLGL